MPRLTRTVIPRIKKSIERRGLLASLFRGALLPIQLFQEHRRAKKAAHDNERSEFDRTYGVDTDGDIGGVTYLSDLDIPSANWIYGFNYVAVPTELFRLSVTSLEINFEEFTFVDFGSGKGRALLLASRLPFKRIIGIEFSQQLYEIAEQNLQRFPKSEQRCTSIEMVCMDFTGFTLPSDPSILFFNRPSDAKLLANTIENIRQSLREKPRQIYIVFVSPVYESIEAVFDDAEFLLRTTRHREEFAYDVYKNI